MTGPFFLIRVKGAKIGSAPVLEGGEAIGQPFDARRASTGQLLHQARSVELHPVRDDPVALDAVDDHQTG